VFAVSFSVLLLDACGLWNQTPPENFFVRAPGSQRWLPPFHFLLPTNAALPARETLQGGKRHGLFTYEFVQQLRATPEQDVESLFHATRETVISQTSGSDSGEQRAWMHATPGASRVHLAAPIDEEAATM